MKKENLPSNEELDDEIKILKNPRSSYSAGNAIRFKLIFDECISKNQNAFIACADIGIKLSTLRVAIYDGLAYLADTQPNIYAVFKNRVVLRTCKKGNKEGILIDYKLTRSEAVRKKLDKSISPSVATFSGIEAEGVEQVSQLAHWKSRVLEYLNDDKQQLLILNKPEDFNFQYLTDVDTEWIAETFTKAGIEFEVGPMMIKAVK